jgi:2-polyprenyl-3-methyl-5-hydroxy-6-metoxy-1,4-benzoquinol methylase
MKFFLLLIIIFIIYIFYNHKENYTNFKAAKKWASNNFKAFKNGNLESSSGPGSSLKVAKETIDLINFTIKKYNIKNIIDLGCGDWNWMRKLNFNNVNYIGYDASEEIINHNKKYVKSNISFEIADIISNIPKKADLCICRDVLFHLENKYILKVLNNIKMSNTKYLITTNFPKIKKNYKLKTYGIASNLGWGYHKINLNIEPFNLNDKLIKCFQESGKEQIETSRKICLYKLF